MLLLNVVIRQLCFLHLLCYVMSCRGWISDRYLSESWIRQICQFLQSRLTRYFLRIGGWLVVCPVGGLSSSGEMRLVHQGGSGVKRQLAKYGKRGENSLYILWKWEGFKTKLYFCRLWVYMMHIAYHACTQWRKMEKSIAKHHQKNQYSANDRIFDTLCTNFWIVVLIELEVWSQLPQKMSILMKIMWHSCVSR